MPTEIRRKVDYIVVCVNEFADRYGLPITDAYFYLRRYGGTTADPMSEVGI